MCVAVPVAMLIVSAASAAASVYAQNQNVKAQNAANQQQYDNTMTAYRSNLANIEVTRNQATADATQKLTENNAAARAAKASATVAAGEGGVSGTSVDALLRDLSGRAAYDNTNVEENYLRQNQALNAKRENVFNSASSDINMLQTPAMPDYLGAAFRIGQAGLNAYGQQQQLEAIKRGDRS